MVAEALIRGTGITIIEAFSMQKLVNMKKTFFSILSLLCATFLWNACDTYKDYPGGVISPYISIFDVRTLHKGSDVTLTTENMDGSNTLAAMVVSDHSGGNLPEGMLVVQDYRRLNLLRGISISLGAAAAGYVTGDSVLINVEGAVLTRKDGFLQLLNVQPANVTKVSSGNSIPVNRVNVSAILANPNNYESTLVAVVKGGFNPLPPAGDVLSGNKVLNDGFGNINLVTNPSSTVAQVPSPVLGNFYGIVFNKENSEGKLTPEHRLRTPEDVVVLSSELELTPLVISGFHPNPHGTLAADSNYEYIQFLATQDINFSETPYSVVTTNNAGASTPTGFPTNGWATGGLRTYKFDITSGFAAKGTYFYVGGTHQRINGENSRVIAEDANWVKIRAYNRIDGEGFGQRTTNLLANSGNASGIAAFRGTEVTEQSVPIDVIFIAAGGNLYTPGPPPRGYRITNTDFYDRINPITLTSQPFYRLGSNTLSLAYTGGDGIYVMLGGVYNVTLGRWTQARAQVPVQLTAASTVTELENEVSTKIADSTDPAAD